MIVNSVRFWDDNLTHAKLTSDFGLSVFMLIGKVARPLFFEVVNEKPIAKIGVETFIPAKPNPIVDYIEIALPRSFVDRGDPLNVGDLITLTGVLNGNAVQGHNITYFNVRASAHNVEASSIVFDYPLDHSI